MRGTLVAVPRVEGELRRECEREVDQARVAQRSTRSLREFGELDRHAPCRRLTHRGREQFQDPERRCYLRHFRGEWLTWCANLVVGPHDRRPTVQLVSGLQNASVGYGFLSLAGSSTTQVSGI